MGTFRDVGEFSLTDQRARSVDEKALEGKVWVANFIFTSCNAECLVLSARFAELQRLFADRPEVAFVSFSVDPQTDTPERLGQFAERWHADPERWLFLTGDSASLDRLIKERFLLPVTRDPMEAGKLLSQSLVHTNRFAIVDRSSTVRAYVDGLQSESVSVISRILLDLLAEPAPAATHPTQNPTTP
jgi:cytochrome oxidase Cu insertion factor (SCO1/SenC/PrrC family)